jgi:hypothetical protein
VRRIHVSALAIALVASWFLAPDKEIELVGPLPAELGVWINWLSRCQPEQRMQTLRAFIRYLLRPESNTVWKPRGLERFE